jgi:hypothetical protein
MPKSETGKSPEKQKEIYAYAGTQLTSHDRKNKFAFPLSDGKQSQSYLFTSIQLIVCYTPVDLMIFCQTL